MDKKWTPALLKSWEAAMCTCIGHDTPPYTQERFSHIGECYAVEQLYDRLREFITLIAPSLRVTTAPSFIYLGLTDSHQVLPPGLSVLHTMVWKFFLIDFVKVDTENAKFKPENVWRAAVLRVQRKIEARHTFLSDRLADALSLRRAPPAPSLDAEDHALPLARFETRDDTEVVCILDPQWRRLVDEMRDAGIV